MPGENESTTRLKIDVSEFQTGIRNAQRQIRLANAEFQNAASSMENWKESTEGIQAKIRQLTQTLDAQEDILDNLEKEYQRVVEANGELSQEAINVKIRIEQQKAAINKTNREINQYRQSLEEVSDESGNLEDGMENASEGLEDVAGESENSGGALSKFADIAGNVVVTGVKLMGAALATAAAGFVSSVKKANDAKKALNGFEASTGSSAKQMKKYEEVMKNIYKNNFGESFDDIADSMSKVKQQLGKIDKATLENVTTKAIALRDTFDMDINESIRGIDGLMKNMGLTADEAFDYVAKGAQNGLNKSDELMDNIAEYSQIWGQAGFSAKEMFTILQNGLDSGAYNLDKVNDFVKEFTISLSDGRIEEGIGNFSEKTKEVFNSWKNGGASQKDVFNSIIADMANMKDEQKALSVASDMWSAVGEDNAMKIITSLNKANNTYKNVKGTMEEINQVKYNTPIEAMEGVGRVIETDFIMPIGEKAMPVFQKFADTVSKGAAKADGDMGKLAGTVAKAAAGLVKGIGKMIADALPDIIDSGSEIVKEIGASIIKNAPNLLASGTDIIKMIYDGIMSAMPGIVSAGAEMLSNLGETIKNNLPGILEKVLDALEGLADMLAANAPKMIQAGIGLLQNLVQGIMNSLPLLIERVPEIISKFANIINDNAPTILKGGVNMILTIVKGIISAIPVLVKNIPKIIKAIIDVWTAFNWLNLGKTAITGLKNGIVKMVGAVKGAGTKVLNGITNILKSLPGKLLNLGRNAINSLRGAITGGISAVSSSATSIFQAVITILRALPGKLLEFGRNAVTKLAAAIGNGASKAAEKAAAVAGKVTETIQKLPEKLLDIGKNVVKGLWNGISDMKGWVISKIQGFSNDVLDGIKEFFGIHSPSRVMRDVVGKNLVRGIAVGIDKEMPKAVNSIENLSKKILKKAKTSMTGSNFESVGEKLGSSITKSIDNTSKDSVQSIKNLINKEVETYSGTVDKKIKELNNQLSKKISKINENDKEDTSDKKEKINEQKKEINADKKLSEKQKKAKIDALNKQLKEISKLSSSSKKARIEALKKETAAEIEVLKKGKTSYKKAGEASIKAYTNAINTYAKNAKAAVSDILDDITDEFQEKYDNLIKAQEDLYSKLSSFGEIYSFDKDGNIILNNLKEQTQAIKNYVKNLKTIKGKVSTELFSEISEMSMEDGAKYISQLLGMGENELKEYDRLYQEKMNTAKELSSGMYQEDIKNLKSQYDKAVNEALKDIDKKLSKIGQQAMQGFLTGMKSQTKNMSKDIRNISGKIVKQFKKELKIHSPSKVFEQMGIYSGEGYMNGLKDTMSSVKNVISDMGVSKPAGVNNKAQQGTGSTTYNFYQTNNSPKALSRYEIYRQTRNQMKLLKGV